MRLNWTQRLFSLLQGRPKQAAAPRAARRSRVSHDRHGAYVSRLEVLEPRALLSTDPIVTATNIIAVSVVNSNTGTAITLNDVTPRSVKAYDTFTVTEFPGTIFSGHYGGIILDAAPGTAFRLPDGTQVVHDTIDATGPTSLSMNLNPFGNTVNIVGPGFGFMPTFDVPVGFNALNVNFGGGTNHNGLSLKNLNADVVNVTNGGTSTVGVTIDHCEIGTLNDTTTGVNSSFATTASIYSGSATITLGAGGVVGLYGSPDGLFPGPGPSGASHFEKNLTINGQSRSKATVYEATPLATSFVIDGKLTLNNVNVTTLKANLALPTVTDPNSMSLTPTITGTCDPGTVQLVVNVGGIPYFVQTNGLSTWRLSIAIPLPANKVTAVTLTAFDKNSSSVSNTGTVTTRTLIS